MSADGTTGPSSQFFSSFSSSSSSSTNLLEDVNMALFTSTMTGDVDAAKEAIDAGASPKYTNAHGLTPLHVCAGGMGPASMMKLLIEAGAEVNAQDKEGWTPLVLVSSSGQIPLLDLLLDAGANVHHATSDTKGWTPVTRAAFRGQAGALKRLFEAGADPFAATSEGKGAREIAMDGGHEEAVSVIDEWRTMRQGVGGNSQYNVNARAGTGEGEAR